MVYLDRLNTYLDDNGITVNILYDSFLDSDSEEESSLKSLLEFWSEYHNRWSNIRCKIFMTPEQYDNTKIRNYKYSELSSGYVDIKWNLNSLTYCLITRLMGYRIWREFLAHHNVTVEDGSMFRGEIDESVNAFLKATVVSPEKFIELFKDSNNKGNHLTPESYLTLWKVIAIKHINSGENGNKFSTLSIRQAIDYPGGLVLLGLTSSLY